MHTLDNVFWHALTGEQAHFAAGGDRAKRYARGFSPLLGFPDLASPDFDAVAPHCDSGERFYVGGWTGPAPQGWRIDIESAMCQMVWNAPAPPADVRGRAQRLGPEHHAAMHELAILTNPGPFGPRTPQLGDYWGVFEGRRLAAMTGERAHAGEFREVSGVCTHPDFRGRGWARDLVAIVVRDQLARGQVPFLHVMKANESARALYRKMGFAERLEQPVRVVTKL
ncbi:GNAT family N-acetyltransferase [Ramlibacter sp. PS4R-6]|uniref:GNAT family N-acetyltransferase n=1 Tax=Ramlibacter sp. PS4R-6 TaxID=3133438 RepID=UPI0030956D19